MNEVLKGMGLEENFNVASNKLAPEKLNKKKPINFNKEEIAFIKQKRSKDYELIEKLNASGMANIKILTWWNTSATSPEGGCS